MNHTPDANHPACQSARELIQLRLDEPLSGESAGALAKHLETCEACRAYDRELASVRGELRAMPAFDLPADVTRQIARIPTEGSGRGDRWTYSLAHRWRPVAAAAAVALAVGAAWWMVTPRETTPSDAEIARAAAQLELVLGVTNQALAAVERTAFQDVLADQVVPAVEHIPLRWPTSTQERDEGGDSPENGSA